MIPPRDDDFDALSEQLGDCLRRIDADIERLLGDDASDPETTAAAIDDRAQELCLRIDDVLAAAHAETGRCEVDRIVDRCVAAAIARAATPLVVRTRLAAGSTLAGCNPEYLRVAVDRALDLAFAHAGSGGEVAIATLTTESAIELAITAARLDGDAAARGSEHLRERALTLQAFVAGWQGRCRLDGDGGKDDGFAIALQLPHALAEDRS